MEKEKLVSNILLEKPIELTIGDRIFKVSQPTLATLFYVSDYIAELPEIENSDESVMTYVVNNSSKCKSITKALACFIIGAKEIKSPSWRWNPFKKHWTVDTLAEFINLNTTPSQLLNLVMKFVSAIGVNDFFSSIVFLKGLNMTKPTKTMPQTVHGR